MKFIHVILPKDEEQQSKGNIEALISFEMINKYGIIVEKGNKILKVGQIRFMGDLSSFYELIEEKYGIDVGHDIEDIISYIKPRE